jgi:Protein of unknown function (DUF1402)
MGRRSGTREFRPRGGTGVGWLLWSALYRVRNRSIASGLAPTEPRPGRRAERRRQEAIAIVSAHAEVIDRVARRHAVAPEAIAGAILWEGLENPRVSLSRHRVGRVQSTELWRPSEAQLAEREGRVQPSRGLRERRRRLHQPAWAIEYVAAILGRHADNYACLAGVRIRTDVAILCTLYQGGDSEMRARRLAARRRDDVAAEPVAGNDMGPWVEEHLAFVRAVLRAKPELRPGEPSSPRIGWPRKRLTPQPAALVKTSTGESTI